MRRGAKLWQHLGREPPSPGLPDPMHKTVRNSNSSPELQPCRAQAVANTQARRWKMAESRFDILQNRRGRSDAGDGGEITSHRAPASSGGFHPASQLSVMYDRSYPGRVCHKIVHPGPRAHCDGDVFLVRCSCYSYLQPQASLPRLAALLVLEEGTQLPRSAFTTQAVG